MKILLDDHLMYVNEVVLVIYALCNLLFVIVIALCNKLFLGITTIIVSTITNINECIYIYYVINSE